MSVNLKPWRAEARPDGDSRLGAASEFFAPARRLTRRDLRVPGPRVGREQRLSPAWRNAFEVASGTCHARRRWYLSHINRKRRQP